MEQRNSNQERSSWTEYGRLVLAELERHGELFDQIIQKQNDQRTQLAVFEDRLNEVVTLSRQNRIELERQGKEIDKLKQGDAIKDAIRTYRNWLLGGIFTLIITGVLPFIKLFLG